MSVEIEQRGQELNNFEEIIEKAIDVKLRQPPGLAFMLATPINIASAIVIRQQPKPILMVSQ